MLTTQISDRLQLIPRITTSASPITSIFQTHKSCSSTMNIIRINAQRNLFGTNFTMIPINRSDLTSGIFSNSPSFINIHMAHFFTNHFIAGLCMTLNGNLIGHGTTRTKNRRLHAKQSSSVRLKCIYRRVF